MDECKPLPRGEERQQRAVARVHAREVARLFRRGERGRQGLHRAVEPLGLPLDGPGEISLARRGMPRLISSETRAQNACRRRDVAGEIYIWLSLPPRPPWLRAPARCSPCTPIACCSRRRRRRRCRRRAVRSRAHQAKGKGQNDDKKASAQFVWKTGSLIGVALDGVTCP